MVLLHAWHDQPPVLVDPPVAEREVAALQRLRESFVDDVLHLVLEQVDPAGGYRLTQVEQLRADLGLALSSLACALLAHDPRVFTDHVAWIRGRLATLGVDGAVVDESLIAIAEVLGPGFPGTGGLLAGLDA